LPALIQVFTRVRSLSIFSPPIWRRFKGPARAQS
jgi:hypothetical protein